MARRRFAESNLPPLFEMKPEGVPPNASDGFTDIPTPDDPFDILEGRDLPELHAKRQDQLFKARGFMASDSTELTHATRLISGEFTSAGQYLAHITRHQKSIIDAAIKKAAEEKQAKLDAGEPVEEGPLQKPKDPEAAARSIANLFGEYANNAAAEISGLTQLRSLLASEHLIHESSLTDIQDLDKWLIEGGTRHSMIGLQRYLDSLDLTRGGEDHLNGKYSSNDPVQIERFQKFIEPLSIEDVYELIEEVDEQHFARRAFWVEQLQQVQRSSNSKTLLGTVATKLRHLHVDMDRNQAA